MKGKHIVCVLTANKVAVVARCMLRLAYLPLSYKRFLLIALMMKTTAQLAALLYY